MNIAMIGLGYGNLVSGPASPILAAGLSRTGVDRIDGPVGLSLVLRRRAE